MGATWKIKLRAGRTVWQEHPFRKLPLASLRTTKTVDVLVVGAGISGALIAESLSAAGLSVQVVDRREPLRGSTLASTALLQYEIDVPLHRLASRIGRTRAERMWRRSRLALDSLRERSRHLGVNADQINRDSLYLEGNELDEAGLRRECEARAHAGFECSFLSPREVSKRFGIHGRAALLGYDNFCADPRRLAAGFLRAAFENGARLASPVEIATVQPQRSSVRAITTMGISIRARSLVFACGYELPKGVPSAGHYIASTWAMATRPQPRKLWPGECLIWEAADPYLYARSTASGRVICGGEDARLEDPVERDALMPEKTALIAKKLGRLFPQLDLRPEFQWCGFFGGSNTGTPSIGPVPRMANCYAALGYGGNGITFSMMAAQMLTGMITGRGDPDSDLVSFTRKF